MDRPTSENYNVETRFANNFETGEEKTKSSSSSAEIIVLILSLIGFCCIFIFVVVFLFIIKPKWFKKIFGLDEE